MKVGIVSMHRVVNSGSFLQAYELKKIIENLGHEVVFIDFRISCGEDKEVLFRIKRYMYFFRNVFHRLFIVLKYPKSIKEKIAKKKAFARMYNSICLPQLGVSKDFQYNIPVDLLVFGSDETFNTAQYIKSGRGYAHELYGENNNARDVITYAVSCGQTHIQDILDCGQEKKIRSLLQSFSAFSARDLNTQNFIEYFTGREAPIHIDPVLLYDFSELQLQPIKESPYLLVYAYSDRIYKSSEKQAIVSFAKKHDLKIIAVNMFQSWIRDNRVVHPFEMLNYFKCAKYIVTDTFHGALISIKFEKQFAVFVREEANNEKLDFLLEAFNLIDRKISDKKTLEEILDLPIEIQDLRELIECSQQSAMQYLTNCLTLEEKEV